MSISSAAPTASNRASPLPSAPTVPLNSGTLSAERSIALSRSRGMTSRLRSDSHCPPTALLQLSLRTMSQDNCNRSLSAPNPYLRVSSQARSVEARRMLSTTPEVSLPPPMTTGISGLEKRDRKSGMPRLTSSSLPAEVEINTTPRTRSPNRSG